MLEEFAIPKHGNRACRGLEESSLNASLVADILDELSENDALYITADGSYERCEEVARNFLKLHPRQRARAVDAFAANLCTLSMSAQNLLSNYEAAPAEAILRHKNGLRMFVYLLHMIGMQAEKDTQQAKGVENAAKPKPAGRGRKAACAADDDEGWDWQHSRQRVLLAVRDMMQVDLKALFKGLASAEQLINLSMELALQALESPAVVKQESAFPACREVLVRGAVLYQQLDFVAAALMERARKHEHLPQLVALLAKYAEEKYNSTQLGVKLLSEFSRVSPEEYDTQYSTNSVSVRLAGDVVSMLAELLPKVVSNQISQLQPYLGCSKAYCLRGSLLAATGSILVQVFPTDALSSSLGEGAAQAHLRSKEALLALLHSRMLDKVAFVRQKVLQTWGKLVEESCVPLSHWNSLLAQAIGRLEDESQLVVKAALQLLNKMVAQGIFQPPLKPQVYINTLHQAEAELKALQPAAEGEDWEGEGVATGDAGGQAGDVGARWEDGDIKIKEEPVECPMDAEQTAAEGQGSHAGKPAAGNEAAIQRLRTMIASLKEGVSFCKRLTSALPQLQVLLANPAAAVVHDTIVFLTLCKTYEVSGAAKALRGMWPLVFSKHEPVRQSVLDSWHILHLHDRPVKQQLEELLLHIIPDSSLSELTALESIIASLVQQGKLSAPLLMKLLVHDTCLYVTQLRELTAAAATTAAAQPQGEGMPADRAGDDADDSEAAHGVAAATLHATLRHCFTLLSLLTAAQPAALEAKYVPVLLEVGFAPDVADAWIARHTCLTLRHAAAHLAPTNTLHAAAAAAAAAAPAANPLTIAAGNDSSDPLPTDMLQNVLAALVKLLCATPAASMAANWPSAAEAAMTALYALAPQPQELVAVLLEEMFKRCKPGGASSSADHFYEYSAAALSRFFFVLGRAALQHLLCVEQLGKAIRASRLAADRAAAEAAERQQEAAAAGGSKKRGAAAAAAAAQQQDDIGALLGVGSVAADVELDALTEMIEAQILAKEQLLGRYGALLSRLCHLKATLSAPQELQASALLALTQLMAVDGNYCSDNVALLFTLLVKRYVSADIRVNMVVALADLASRFPNVLEQWTACIYEPLTDPVPAVKLAALSSLTHLVLGGMVKAKGNVAKVAMLLVDDDQEIADRAALFFDSLARTGSGSSRASAAAAAGASAANPVYNLLPDCLSALMLEKGLREEQLQAIMGLLLAYVKDKQAESLKERLVARLQVGGPREWRLVAWCISQLGYSEKGLRRIMEMAPCYRHTLAEEQVFAMFMSLAEKARRSTGGSGSKAAADSSSAVPAAPGDLRAAVEEWMADLQASREAAVEAAEVEAMEEARRQQQQNERKQQAAAGGEGQQEQHQQGSGNGAENEDAGQQQAAAAAGEQMDDGQDAAASDEEGDKAAVDAGGSDSADPSEIVSGEQISLMQSQDVQDMDDGEALEAAASAMKQQQLMSRLQRLSLADRSAAAGVATADAGAKEGRGQRAGAAQRKSSAAAAAAAAGGGGGGGDAPAKRSNRGSASASAARRTSRAATAKTQPAKRSAKEYSSSGSESSSDVDSEDASSNSSDDEAGSGDQRQQAVSTTNRKPSRGQVAGGGGAISGATKRAAHRRSSGQQQQRQPEMQVVADFSESEDDD